MNFLYPSFLWALAALAIPVIVHLFNFQRPKKVLFTNVRFLRSVKEATNSARQLREWLILLMRLLFVACLVMAFAQPFLRAKSASDLSAQLSRVGLSVYIDNSQSMQSETNNGQALDAAATRAEALVGAYPQNTQFHLLTNDFDGKGQYFVNADKMRERIAEIKLSNNYRDLSTINKRQLSAFEANSNTQKGEVFWFSDFQKSTVGDLSQITPDSTKQYYLLPVQQAEASNVLIDSVWLVSPFVKANENNTLNVKVFNSGNKPLNDVSLRLFIDEVQVSTVTVNIAAMSATTTPFTFNISSGGTHRCRIALNDQPVTFDNEYYFVLKSAPPIKVMHIFETEASYMKAVFGNKQYFDLQQFSYKNIRYDAFGKADLIVLDGLQNIEAGLVDALQQALKRGQSVAVFPSEKSNIANYQSCLLRLNTLNIQAAQDSASQEMQVPDIRNPFFEGVFEQLPQNSTMPSAYAKITWNTSGTSLLKFKNDKPFLGMWPMDKAKLYVASAPVYSKKQSNSFAQHALFVPVMYRMAIRSLNETEQLAFSFQQAIVSVEINDAPTDQVFSLEKGNIKVIPSQRIVGKKLLLELPKNQMVAGYYDLKINNKTEKTIALNYGKSESKLQYYSPEELQKIFSAYRNVKVFDTLDKQDITDDLKAKNVGTPLWKYAIMLALLFLFAEVVLIRFWK